MSISRRTFATGAAAAPIASAGLAFAAAGAGDEFYAQIVRSNDESIAGVIEESSGSRARSRVRSIGTNVCMLAASYCAPESKFYRSQSLIAPMERAARTLLEAQHPDGTIDSGNLNSPPDTGFVVETVCTALAVLRKSADSKTEKVQKDLGAFVVAAGEALVTGGVHTPNHRWVITSALARINSLFPARKYVERIDDWLGEGIYIDADGQYPERSVGIYSRVENTAFITMARLLNRPALLAPVRRNLDMTLYYVHPDGELETVGSRRQDHNTVAYVSNYYLEYRYMAAKDGNATYAALVRQIEESQADQVKRSAPLINFLEDPMLRSKLPEGGTAPSDYTKLFANTKLARIRRGAVSGTIYGGSDWPLGVASGLASNPTFFTFRNGKAVLESVRMAGNFFSEGAFRSDGLRREGSGYVLHQRFDVPYYLPLPKSARNATGDYKLTPAADERFWSKLNFPARAVSHVQSLDQKVTIVENDGTFELQFEITGHDRVPFVVELAFRRGGTFSGQLVERTKGAVYLLKEGMARYRVGGDVIEFGPGEAEHEFLDLSGSSYKAHGARLVANGECVYIAGFTPFRKTITIRAGA